MRNKSLIAGLLVVTLLVFGALLWIHHLDTVKEMEELRRQAEEDGGYIDIWAEELRTVEEELRNLDIDDYGDAGKGLGSYLFLVTEPDYGVMTDVEPALTEYGITGHLCVSESSFPDDEGNCSRWQAGLLTEVDWDFCIEVTDDTNISDLLYRMWLIDLPEPVAAYLPDGSCLKNKAQELLDAGISIVVIKDNIPDELPAGITAVPCVGISADNMSSAASSYASDGICFAFTIGFEGSDDQFSYDSLDSAVDTGNAISESYGAGIADFTRMKELTDKRNALVSEAINKNIEKRDELIRRREELQELITSRN